MINVSSAFKTKLNNDERNFIYNINIELDDGTKIPTIDNDKLWENTLKIEDAVSGSGRLDVGAAIIGKLTFTLNNIYDDFSQYDFNNAKVTLFIGLELDDGTVERFQKGVYYVDDPRYNGATITLECLDSMSKFDRPYSESTLAYPTTLIQILRDACTKCGVALQTYEFDNDDYIVKTRPLDNALTFREVIQWVAQISVKYCRCDVYGRLVLGWYDQSAFEKQANLSGGIFDSDTPYSTGDGANGGTFKPWNVGDGYDGGQFTDQKGFHHIYSISSMSVSTDDVVITGVKVEEQAKDNDSEQITHLSGMDGYIVSITGNKFVEYGKGQTVSNYIGSRLIGFRFRKASFSHLSNPTIESGDVAYLTGRKQNTYSILISSTSYAAGSYQSSESSAETPGKNSATKYSESTKNYVDYRNGLKREKTEREKALEELGERLDNSSGAFTTMQTQPDGSVIYYLHNKPALAESDIIWKMTAEAWTVSTDSGKTWNAGMSVDGDTIVRILEAVGINASWINGGVLTVGGINNQRGYIQVVDEKSVEGVRIDRSGISYKDIMKLSAYQYESIGFTSFLLKDTVTDNCVSFSSSGFLVSKANTNNVLNDYVVQLSNIVGYGQLSVRDLNSDNVLFEAGPLSVYVRGNFYAFGTKSRVADTKNYEKKLLYCYEMPIPMFGDIGEAIIGDDGNCYVFLDDIFSETVNTDCEYQVFLQKEGFGDLWVDSKESAFFVVKGTPGLKFAWEIKVKQKGFEFERLETLKEDEEPAEKVDYESQASQMVEKYYRDLEEMFYEEGN